MIWPKRLRIIYKTIAGALAIVFLWQQVVWAGAGGLSEPLIRERFPEMHAIAL